MPAPNLSGGLGRGAPTVGWAFDPYARPRARLQSDLKTLNIRGVYAVAKAFFHNVTPLQAREVLLSTIEVLPLEKSSSLLALRASERFATWCGLLMFHTGRAQWLPMLWRLPPKALRNVARLCGIHSESRRQHLVGWIAELAVAGPESRANLISALARVLDAQSPRPPPPALLPQSSSAELLRAAVMNIRQPALTALPLARADPQARGDNCSSLEARVLSGIGHQPLHVLRDLVGEQTATRPQIEAVALRILSNLSFHKVRERLGGSDLASGAASRHAPHLNLEDLWAAQPALCARSFDEMAAVFGLLTIPRA